MLSIGSRSKPLIQVTIWCINFTSHEEQTADLAAKHCTSYTDYEDKDDGYIDRGCVFTRPQLAKFLWELRKLKRTWQPIVLEIIL